MAIRQHALGQGILEGNLITGNTALGGGDSRAVFAGTMDWTISRNTIRDNDTRYALYFGGGVGASLNAEDNYWGTTDAAIIADNIYDFFDDAARGLVDFEPFLDAEPPLSLVAANGAATTPEDNPVTITLAGADPDSDNLTFAIVTHPSHGALSNLTQHDNSGPNDTATVTYAPNPNFNGDDSFTFTVDDGIETSSEATVTITVAPVADTFPVGDVSGDGSVTAYDASLILQFVVGLIDRFPVEDLIGNSPKHVAPRDYEVSLPEISLKAGERVFVPVEINDTAGLTAGGITLTYDPTVIKAVDVTFPIRQSYWEANTDLTGEVRFAFVNANGTASADKLLLIEFEALPNTEGQTSPLILDQVQLLESLSIQKVDGLLTVLPSEFRLHQNYPNPFNPETWIPYDLAADANVSITIYNAQGHQVRTLLLGTQSAGSYVAKDKAVHWNGRSETGEWVSSGIYFYHLQAYSVASARSIGGNRFTATRKMIISK